MELSKEQLTEIGLEIISGMHAQIHDGDMEYGRAETATLLQLPTPEELKESGLTEIPDYCYRAVAFEKKILDDQAAFMENVLVDKIRQMGLTIVNAPASDKAAE